MAGKTIILFILIGLWSSISMAAEPISINILIHEALQNNPEIKAAKDGWKAAMSAVPQAKTLKDPQFSIMFDSIPNSTIDPGSSMARVYSLTQEFPYPGKRTLMGRIAEKEAQMSFEKYREKEKDIIRDITNAYYDYFIVFKAIEVNIETKEILNHLSKIAEARYATGLVSQWDVLKSQIDLAQLANEIILLNQEKEATAARINIILNKDVDDPLEIPPTIEHKRDVPSIEHLKEIALKERPELIGMEKAIERQDAALSLARKDYYPDFMVKLSRREEDGDAAGWSAELGATIPIWFGKKQTYAVKESVSMLSAARKEYQSMKNMVFLEIKDALVKINSSESLIKLHKSTHIPQAEQALKGAMVGYETGKVDFLPLMESVKTVKGYRLDYYKALASFEQAWAELERAVGKELKYSSSREEKSQ